MMNWLSLATLPYYVLAPYVDNWLGILTKRDLERFFEFDVRGRRLRAVIEERVHGCKWSVQHEGFLWASVVECFASGKGVFKWEVSNEPLRPWLEPGLYITPLNRAAAALVPELLPKGSIDHRMIPLSRYASGVIYDGVDPEKAHEWLAPLLKRMKPLRGGPTTGCT